MELHEFPVRQPEDFDAAFARILESRMDAVGLVGDVVTFAARKRIVEFASRSGLPSTFGVKGFVVEGGLLSYGADHVETTRKTGTCVGRILKGSNPGDLPDRLRLGGERRGEQTEDKGEHEPDTCHDVCLQKAYFALPVPRVLLHAGLPALKAPGLPPRFTGSAHPPGSALTAGS